MIPLSFARILRDRPATRSRFIQLFSLTAILLTVLALNFEMVHGPARYLNEVRAEAWVTMPGNENLIANSYFTSATLRRLRHSPGVVSADGVFLNYTAIRAGRKSVNGIALAYDPTGITAPRLSVGHQVRRPGETVLDTLLPRMLGVGVGGFVRIGALRLKIVGLAPGVNSIAKDVAFLDRQDMARLTGAPVYGAAAVAGRLSSIRAAAKHLGLRVYSKAAWIRSNVDYWNTAITPLFEMVVAAVTLFGALLVASSLRREIEADRHTTAVLLALGRRRRHILSTEYVQVGLIGVVAFLAAIPVAIVLIRLADLGVAGISATLDGYAVLRTAALVSAVCVFAPLGPLWRLMRTDPASVYRG